MKKLEDYQIVTVSYGLVKGKAKKIPVLSTSHISPLLF